jgi:predicted dehydrogenase
MTPVDAILIGAGGRGNFAYGPYALQFPEHIRFIGVADPDPVRRAHFADQHDIGNEMQFETWQDVCARPQLARAAINCTQDQMHFESSIALMKAGYDLLLEKPMAASAAECIALVETSEKLGRHLQICHVLRFTAFFTALYDIINSGRLGRIMTIDHRENVSWWHMSHSFVRGNWRNSALSTPMILAKCCHDLDILVWTMGQTVTALNSFGRLDHFRAENAPEDAPAYCVEGCPIQDTCRWYAPNLYANDENSFLAHAAFGPQSEQLSRAGRIERLRTSPYGRCVYRCDNDVVDHQVMTLQFEGGATATFTMHGHSDQEGRSMRWDGTEATLYGDFTDGRPHEIRICDHGSDKIEVIHPNAGDSGHGGGDTGLMRDFVQAMHGVPSRHRTSARASLQSHLLAFAAEQSRLEQRVIRM